jgi:guanylate kinase
MASAGELLEQAELYGHQYGTPRGFVEDRLGRSLDVLLVLDACGRHQLARSCGPDLVSVFLLPPSRREPERRLCGRSCDEERSVSRRLAAARGEIARCGEYDYVLVNAGLEGTVERLDAILRAGRLRRQRLTHAPG